MQTYRYRSVAWSPGTRLARPLKESKLALITTAGLHLPEQPPFDDKIRGGDYSFREIPTGCNVLDLRIAHRSSAFDQAGALEDRNVVFPLDRLRDLVEWGEVGALNHRHFSFMGSIAAPGRLLAETAPAVAKKLHEDQASTALLVPV